MTPQQIAAAPVGKALPKRSELDLQIDAAWHYARFSLTPEMREHWELRLRELQAMRKAA